jgi:hypothetical protein
MRNSHRQAGRRPHGAWASLTIGVHVISRHLGWGEALSEGIRAVDTLFDGQELLWGGQSRVGVHDPFHPSTPTTVCLSCGTKKETGHSQFAAQQPTPDFTSFTTRCPLFLYHMDLYWAAEVSSRHGSLLPPEQVIQDSPKQKPPCLLWPSLGRHTLSQTYSLLEVNMKGHEY